MGVAERRRGRSPSRSGAAPNRPPRGGGEPPGVVLGRLPRGLVPRHTLRGGRLASTRLGAGRFSPRHRLVSPTHPQRPIQLAFHRHPLARQRGKLPARPQLQHLAREAHALVRPHLTRLAVHQRRSRSASSVAMCRFASPAATRSRALSLGRNTSRRYTFADAGSPTPVWGRSPRNAPGTTPTPAHATTDRSTIPRPTPQTMHQPRIPLTPVGTSRPKRCTCIDKDFLEQVNSTTRP